MRIFCKEPGIFSNGEDSYNELTKNKLQRGKENEKKKICSNNVGSSNGRKSGGWVQFLFAQHSGVW